MSTFKVQVEDLVGRTITDTDALDDMLLSTAREVADTLPTKNLVQNATLTEVTSNPTSISDSRILSVSRNGFYANEVPYGQSARIADTGSIYYADATQDRDPVFYYKGSSLFILDTPTSSQKGEILSFAYPSDFDGSGNVNTTTSINNFPSSAEYAVVLGASAKFMIKLSSEENANEDIELQNATLASAQNLEQDYRAELQRIRGQK
jgi:hypothetical protein